MAYLMERADIVQWLLTIWLYCWNLSATLGILYYNYTSKWYRRHRLSTLWFLNQDTRTCSWSASLKVPSVYINIPWFGMQGSEVWIGPPASSTVPSHLTAPLSAPTDIPTNVGVAHATTATRTECMLLSEPFLTTWAPKFNLLAR